MFYLALRHLLSRRKQSFLTLLGILFGSMAFIAISGIMLGFRYYLIEKLVSSDAHIKITARETYLQERSLDSSFFPEGSQQHIFWTLPPSGRKDENRIIDVQGSGHRENPTPSSLRRVPGDRRIDDIQNPTIDAHRATPCRGGAIRDRAVPEIERTEASLPTSTPIPTGDTVA